MLTEILDLEELKVPHITVGEANPAFLPVHLTGGIGDAILAIPTLRRLKAEGYHPMVYTPHIEALQYFYDVPAITDAMPIYTWHLEVNSIARFKFSKRFGGFLRECHRVLFEQQQAFFQSHADIEWLVHEHPKHKHLLTRRLRIHHNAMDFPLYSLGFENIDAAFDIGSPEGVRATGSYITIHDGFDASYRLTGNRATKQWNLEHWNALVRMVKRHHPDLEIIQLGGKTARHIYGVTSKVDKTTITEAFDIIAKSRLHIDTDSGLAHAATALGVPCVVMFGPTPKEFYGHPQNINLSSKDSCAGGCFHLTEDWMDKCPIGYSSPRCMDDIPPKMVMEAVQLSLGHSP